MKLNKLPSTRGSFTAKTDKKTKMFVYAVSGSPEDIAQYIAFKETEGFYTADEQFGPLFFTSRNIGIQATAEIYTDTNGDLKLSAYNEELRKAEELKDTGISQDYIDALIIKALTAGSYAKIIKEA